MSVRAQEESRGAGGSIRRALAELRRAEPETRAVLAGLVLVLGAWIGPGLHRSAVAGEMEVAATEVVDSPVTGGDAYARVIRAAAAPEEVESRPEARPADED